MKPEVSDAWAPTSLHKFRSDGRQRYATAIALVVAPAALQADSHVLVPIKSHSPSS